MAPLSRLISSTLGSSRLTSRSWLVPNSLANKVLMIKAGHHGAYLRTGDVGTLNASTPLRLPVDNWSNRELWTPPFPVAKARLKNACGAGDSAVAGFLTAMLDGMDIEKAGRCAMRAGRDNLYGVDALSGLSDWTQMTRDARSRSDSVRVVRGRRAE